MKRPRKVDMIRNKCVAVRSTGQAWTVPVRVAESCADPTVLTPDVFAPPAVAIPLQVELRTPSPLVLSNEEYTLRCTDVQNIGTHGPDVIIEAGAEEETLVWTSVPDITPEQLDYIARVDGLYDTLTQTEPAAADVESLTGLDGAQAVYVSQTLAILKARLTTTVSTVALLSLKCAFLSGATTITCDDPLTATNGQTAAGDTAGVRNPVFLAAGRTRSENSQDEADQLALTLARTLLVCLVGNDAQTVECADLGFSEDVPVDDIAQTTRRRVGQAALTENVFFANTKAEANTQARNAALALLDCFYLNEEQNITCLDVNPAFSGVFQSPTDTTSATPGNPVTAPAGQFVSEGSGASTAVANQLALDAATALLECRYKNEEQVVRCPPYEADGIVLPPRDADAFVVIAAGEVESTSLAEANALAQELGRMQLLCLYCNAYIPPTCYPASYTPVPAEAIPLAHVTSAWSSDATLGLAAGVICMEDATAVSQLATVVAVQPPVSVADGCTYLNDEMWFGCLTALPGSFTAPPGGYHAPAYPGNAVLPPGYEGTPEIEQLDTFCRPEPASSTPYIVLEAGAYMVNSNEVPTGQDPKDWVNAKARLYGLALLDCVFANPDMTLNCNTAFDGGFVQADVAQDGGQTVSTFVARGTFTSHLSFADAVLQAKQAARGLLECYYENPEMRVRCWSDYGQPGSLPSKLAGQEVYGTGEARQFWTVGVESYNKVVTLMPYQIGSVSLPVLVGKGLFRSLISQERVTADALLYAVANLDCSAQAQDMSICNDPMLIFCGGEVEVNPTSPKKEGTGQQVTENWTIVDGGVLQAGNGHNYVMSKKGGSTWFRLDLGCSPDPVGGCEGAGLYIEPCTVRASTRDEANRLAYQMMRGALSCESDVPIPETPEGGGDGGGGGAPGNDGAQTNCQGQCLAVYS